MIDSGNQSNLIYIQDALKLQYIKSHQSCGIVDSVVECYLSKHSQLNYANESSRRDEINLFIAL